MKLFSVFITALLSLAVDATPLPEGGKPFRGGVLADRFSQRVTNESADGAAEAGDLAKRSQLTCEIVNVVTTVDCHYWPTHADVVEGYPAVENYVVTSFGPSTKHDFDCYLPGENVGGITAWDYANNWGCFVPGYYTDSHCTHEALGLCWT